MRASKENKKNKITQIQLILVDNKSAVSAKSA